MLKVVCDTNIIVSSLTTTSGNPYEVLEAWRRDQILLLVSETIVGEVVDVLGRPFFRDKRGINQRDIARVRHLLETDAVMVSPKTRLNVVKDDADDNAIIESAWEGEADYLVSGDHRLLALGRYRHIQVVTAKEFVAILKETLGRG